MTEQITAIRTPSVVLYNWIATPSCHFALDPNLNWGRFFFRFGFSFSRLLKRSNEQLTASHSLDVNTTFDMVPNETTGTRRALLIGINYTGHAKGQLSGCHNDVKNMMEYIKDCHGFDPSNIAVLLDDGEHTSPTKANLLQAYKDLVASAQPGDSLFCHYSGHGAKICDDELREEHDNADETLCPLDYHEAGMIRDDDLFNTLVKPLPDNFHLVCLMDCCHSGIVLDLPYRFKADGKFSEMEIDEGFDFDKMLNKFGSVINNIRDILD